jgi:hypothetical protein
MFFVYNNFFLRQKTAAKSAGIETMVVDYKLTTE